MHKKLRNSCRKSSRFPLSEKIVFSHYLTEIKKSYCTHGSGTISCSTGSISRVLSGKNKSGLAPGKPWWGVPKTARSKICRRTSFRHRKYHPSLRCRTFISPETPERMHQKRMSLRQDRKCRKISLIQTTVYTRPEISGRIRIRQ